MHFTRKTRVGDHGLIYSHDVALAELGCFQGKEHRNRHKVTENKEPVAEPGEEAVEEAVVCWLNVLYREVAVIEFPNCVVESAESAHDHEEDEDVDHEKASHHFQVTLFWPRAHRVEHDLGLVADEKRLPSVAHDTDNVVRVPQYASSQQEVLRVQRNHSFRAFELSFELRKP